MNRLLTLVCATALFCVATSHAQSLVDRKVHRIAVVPNSAGTHDVHVIWTAGIDGTSAGLNASTTIFLFRNNNFEVPIETESIEIISDFTDGICGSPNCGAGCGGGFIDGVFNTMLCLNEPPGCDGCGCGCQFPWITTSFPGIELEPGDTLTAETFASPDAFPEQPGDNNALTQTFTGEGNFWNRRLRDVTITPADDPVGTFDVEVEFDSLTVGQDQSEFVGLTVIILANGQAVAEFDGCGNDPWLIDPGNPCNATGGCPDAEFCASSSCAGTNLSHQCEPFAAGEPGFPLPGCGCLSEPVFLTIPGLALAPDDELVFILVPATGALPELPGFEQDDEMPVPFPDDCPADLNNNGSVDGADLGLLLGAFNSDDQDADLNEDGNVDGADLGLLLGQWGACDPV